MWTLAACMFVYKYGQTRTLKYRRFLVNISSSPSFHQSSFTEHLQNQSKIKLVQSYHSAIFTQFQYHQTASQQLFTATLDYKNGFSSKGIRRLHLLGEHYVLIRQTGRDDPRHNQAVLQATHQGCPQRCRHVAIRTRGRHEAQADCRLAVQHATPKGVILDAVVLSGNGPNGLRLAR